MKVVLRTIAIVFVLTAACFPARADATGNEEILREIQVLKARIAELEQRLEEREKKETALAGKERSVPPEPEQKKSIVRYAPGEGVTIEGTGLSITPTATVVLQGAPNPNTTNRGEFNGSWIACLGFTQKFKDWGEAYLLLESGDGNTVQPNLDLFNQVNYNAFDIGANVEARRYHYAQYLFDKQFTILCGRAEARNYLDFSKYAGNDDIQFLGYMFNRSPVIEWPAEYGLTLHTKAEPKQLDFLEFAFNYFDALGEWEQVFENGLYTAEIKIKSAELLNLDPKDWDGNYRFTAWLNNRKHRKLIGDTSGREINYGFSFGFDQAIAPVYGVFGRFGWQRPDLVPAGGGDTIFLSWSGGARMKGNYWRRENDVFGVAVGQLFPSGDFKDAGNPAGVEGHFETYYSFALNKQLYISPDFQLIWNPNGVTNSSQGDDDTIFVYGARAHLVF